MIHIDCFDQGNGTIFAWGENSYGQLGDGSTNNQNSPEFIAGVSNVIQVSAGGYHSLVLLGKVSFLNIFSL